MFSGPKGSATQPDARSDRSGNDDSGGEPPPQSFVGRRVGAYLITKRLGAGGVGEVFRGHDAMLKREVAIKVLRDELACDPLFLERFRQEAQLHAKLIHPNVACVHAFLNEGDKQYMVMEYVAGVSLEEFVRSGGPVPVERALGMFRHALDGIAHAHRCGIVHRDIKPANIMLADDGQVKVMDFGIARALDNLEHLTRHGQVAGTAKSMSPEQIRGAQADVRSDIYSLGIVLYTLLAGRAPFEGASDHALMKAQLEQVPPPLRALVENLPPTVEAAVMRALEKDPSARFQTVGAFSRALDACLAEITTMAPSAGDPPDATASQQTVLNPAVRDAQASSKTAVNPAVLSAHCSTSADQGPTGPRQGPRHRPAAALRSLRRLDRRFVAVALLVGTVSVGARLAHREAPASESPRPIAVSPAAQQAVAPLAQHTVIAQAQEPAPALMPQPTPLPPPVVEPSVRRALSIVRMPGDKADAAAAESDGNRFKPGERVKLLVTTSHDAHVYCYLQDETRHVLRFYPNRFSKSARVRTDAPLEIPGNMRFEIVANTRNVAETIACFASERDVAAKLPAAVVGTDMARLPVTSLDQVRSAFARTAGDSLTEASFRIEIETP